MFERAARRHHCYPFYTVWRSGLWIKLISFGITGKLFNVVRNMYNNVKSCVQLNNNKSTYNCYTGVRQGGKPIAAIICFVS